MRAAGVSDAAIEEALYVATMFNILGRFADAFDFALTKPEDVPKVARVLLKIGYKTAAVPG
jgi:hypothetical protein